MRLSLMGANFNFYCSPFSAVPFSLHLRVFLATIHIPIDPNNYVNEIQSLEKLRAQAMRPTRDMEGCAILKRYYCQLCFLMKKLPVLKDSASSNDQILWYDF